MESSSTIVDKTRQDKTRQDKTRQDKTRQDKTRQPIVQNSNRKILLVTLYGNFNFGNILQRCALTSMLESFGFEVEHLCRAYKFTLLQRIMKPIKRTIKKILAALGVRKFILQFQDELRENRFRTFQDKHTGKKIFTTFKDAIQEAQSRWNEYDYAVTGSDQVWHGWNHTQEELAFYYLEFMPRDKRINYAPSFGFSEFVQSDVEFHRKGLEGFSKLSCREDEMQPLIKQLTGQESELVLDPTLLLNLSDWKKFSSKPEYDLPDKYVLCYFLGKITDEYEHAINQIAGDLPIVRAYDWRQPETCRYMPQYLTHPGEFLYLFEHADFICTDSFHGTAFSINFGKNFMAFKRFKADGTSAGMFGRIESITSNMGITNHIYEPGIKLPPDEIDYELVNQKLNSLRNSSIKYLRECLKR